MKDFAIGAILTLAVVMAAGYALDKVLDLAFDLGRITARAECPR